MISLTVSDGDIFGILCIEKGEKKRHARVVELSTSYSGSRGGIISQLKRQEQWTGSPFMSGKDPMLESTKLGILPSFFFGSRESLFQLQTDRKTERRVRGHSGSAYLGQSPAAGFHCPVHIRSWCGDARFPGQHVEAIETALGSSRSEQLRDGAGHPPLRWRAVTAGWLVADDRCNERFGAAAPPGRRRARARLPRQIDTRGAAEDPLARNFLVRKRRGAGCWTGTDWHQK